MIYIVTFTGYAPDCLSSTKLLLLPLSNDPRFIQCIYRYTHASKRFVEVFYAVSFVNILDLDQVRRLSGLVCVQAVNGSVLWWQPKLLPLFNGWQLEMCMAKQSGTVSGATLCRV